jgi:hypothetical protein
MELSALYVFWYIHPIRWFHIAIEICSTYAVNNFSIDKKSVFFAKYSRSRCKMNHLMNHFIAFFLHDLVAVN